MRQPELSAGTCAIKLHERAQPPGRLSESTAARPSADTCIPIDAASLWVTSIVTHVKGALMSGPSRPAAARGRFDVVAAQSALAVAVRAPSIHNTQPWRWRLDEHGLTLLADRTRQLRVADPDGHSLLVSCGAAMHLTEAALRAEGWVVQTTVLPQPDDADVLARFQPRERQAPDPSAMALADAALRRRSDRRPFAHQPLSPASIDALRAAVGDTKAWVDFPHNDDQRADLAVAVSWADRVVRNDDAYQAEMQAWLREPDIYLVEGVPMDAVPHVPADQPRKSDVPQRDFEVGMTGAQLIARDVDERPLIAVVFTESDTARDHLEAGRAMMQLMLKAELTGLASCPMSQAVDFTAFRTRMQGLMGWVGYPQIMVRLGYPGGPAGELARTPRRPPQAVLDVATRSASTGWRVK